MIFQRLILLYVLSIVLSVGLVAGESVNDPYQILKKHYAAVGGLDILKAQKTTYTHGTVSIEGAGLKGTFRQWDERPLKMRQEIDLIVVKSVFGDNGDYAWSVDPNGKILVQRDERTMQEREIKKLMNQYEHVNPNSPYFKISYKGIEKVDNEDCYLIEITNVINEDTLLNYYSTNSFYLLKAASIKPAVEQQVSYSDFRQVAGMILPFREIVETLPTHEKQIFEYTAYQFNVEIEPHHFEPPKTDVEDFQFVDGESAEDVPFSFIENHIYLPVNIIGKERLWVLDCGAGASVIDSSYAVELGLELEGPVKGIGASGTVDFYFVTVPSYTMGGIRFNEQRVMAMNMRRLFQRVLGLDVVGILGYDFLSRFVIKIDYANEKISFYHPEKFEYKGNGKVIDSPLEHNMFSLPLTVDDTYSGKWILDIGATGEDFHYPYARDHNLLDLKGIDVMAAGAAAEFMVRTSQFKTMSLEDFTIKNPLIGVPRAEGQGAFSHRGVVGNIGNSFLRHFVLYLDYKNQRVILEKGDNYDKEFPKPKSGLQLLYTTDHDIEVHFVAQNTPAGHYCDT
ncbi:MAG: hypothetical protein AYK18_07990 [Theionarchaea archaeon DG-70]|nr:MAG: hypothetical protein AYK18_07990 [Theionarchaea archaeon DG-70]